MIPTELQAGLGEAEGGVFYLHGADEHRKEAAARALVEAHLDPATADFNYDLIRGSEASTESLASTLGTPPMMAQWRVVLLRETQALASSPRLRSLLLELAKSPPPGLALILLCTVPSGSKAAFYRELARASRSLEFSVPGVHDLPAWIMRWGRESFGRAVREDAARALAQALGSDTSALAQELEKLATLTDEDAEITLHVVRSAGTRIPQQNRWEWFDLVGERRFVEALEGLQILLEHGETGVGLLIGLTTHLLRLGIVADGGLRELEEALPANQRWLARRHADRYLRQAQGWTVPGIEGALAGLLQVDRLLKASSMTKAHFLESWILEQASAQAEAA